MRKLEDFPVKEIEEAWVNSMLSKGHTPRMSPEGRLDIFVHKSNGNGPGCMTCLKSWNWHQVSNLDIDYCENYFS